MFFFLFCCKLEPWEIITQTIITHHIPFTILLALVHISHQPLVTVMKLICRGNADLLKILFNFIHCSSTNQC